MHSLELLPILLGPDSLAAAPAPPCFHRVGVLGCRAASLRKTASGRAAEAARQSAVERPPPARRTPGIR